MRREKPNYVVVVEGQPSGAKSLSVGRKVELATDDSGFELYSAISAVAEALQDCLQVGQEEDGDAGVGGEVLLQAQVAGLGTKVSLFQEFEPARLAAKEVGAGTEAFDGVDEQVQMVELSAKRLEEVRRHTAGCALEQGGKLRESDGLANKLASGTATENNALDWVATYFRFFQRLKRNKFACRLV